jgi:hypothetical protein
LREEDSEGVNFLDQPLVVVEGEMTGKLAEEAGGLGAALWSGASCETATDALAALATQLEDPLPGIADLGRRLVLSRTAPPAGCSPASQFLAARVCLLKRLGFETEAAQLAESEPGSRPDCPTAPGIVAEPESAGERLALAVGALAQTCAEACNEDAVRVLQENGLSGEAARIVAAAEKARGKAGGG